MTEEQIVGKSLDDLIVSLHRDIQAAAEAIAQAGRRPAAESKTAAPRGREEPPMGDVIFAINAASVDLKAAVALEAVPKQEEPRLVAYPVGFRLRPEAQAVSSLQLNFAPLPRPPAAPTTATVPDGRQKRWSEAIAVLQNAGLTLGTVTERPIPSIAPGTVFSQHPEPGTEVPVGTPVDLVVAEAAALVVVPNVVRLMLKKAVEVIEAAGLRVGEIKEEVSTQPPGTVLAQNPPAGEEIAPVTLVNLVVAVRLVPVPNVVGKSLAEAKEAITAAGLAVGTARRRRRQQVPKDQVIEQKPESGEVPVGTAVDLIVSSGPRKA